MIEIFNLTINLKTILYPIIYIAMGIIFYEILKTITDKSLTKSNSKSRHKQKQAETLKVVLVNLIKYVDIILVILAVLTVFGINVKSILAGLGVTAVLVGLAFQDIAKDILAGISIILEDQYEIGDIVEIDGFVGEVIFIGLRTTRVRNLKGATKIISNHTITNIINYNLHNISASIDVSVDYDQNTEKVEKVLTTMAKNLEGKIENTYGPINVLGIDDLADSAVIYKIAVESDSTNYLVVQRILRKEVKKALDDANIKIPFPQVEVHNGK